MLRIGGFTEDENGGKGGEVGENKEGEQWMWTKRMILKDDNHEATVLFDRIARNEVPITRKAGLWAIIVLRPQEGSVVVADE